ncbi:MAG: phage Gp37/Gp68 family protein [Candidatus Scalindua rubra]|uniref:Putative phage protein n=1 Tax=Candidatus Scalindua brodae TaxID=237368 RepID=A0A0B0EMI3_9BACT|nr:MAG: putative phage protein [Candidatus Scalindua brodae]MBZ0109742.1 phage Gp37/Gp68 family protein [Candidatus Scalindua rubra]TWU32384.1 Phage protein Gp37/Gp68 [Candidatus Brocadiaceae bacterium S225]
MNKSKIEWMETTWNPVTGCNKISEGCDNCYAERMTKRLKAMGELNLSGIDWVIVGGGSGPKARSIDADWVRDQCVEQNVPFFFQTVGRCTEEEWKGSRWYYVG